MTHPSMLRLIRIAARAVLHYHESVAAARPTLLFRLCMFITVGSMNFEKAVSGGPGTMYVYYCRTYEKAVSGGGRGGKRRTCAKGHYQPRPVRSSLATSLWRLFLIKLSLSEALSLRGSLSLRVRLGGPAGPERDNFFFWHLTHFFLEKKPYPVTQTVTSRVTWRRNACARDDAAAGRAHHGPGELTSASPGPRSIPGATAAGLCAPAASRRAPQRAK